ncbi:hypothetical protein T492DRAFT_867711 [Pavlovales sp. CCMP2436]|nr:hypothetical protein T492DRAFT_867711 [Pavlovales sp. CCMP2436]
MATAQPEARNGPKLYEPLSNEPAPMSCVINLGKRGEHQLGSAPQASGSGMAPKRKRAEQLGGVRPHIMMLLHAEALHISVVRGVHLTDAQAWKLHFAPATELPYLPLASLNLKGGWVAAAVSGAGASKMFTLLGRVQTGGLPGPFDYDAASIIAVKPEAPKFAAAAAAAPAERAKAASASKPAAAAASKRSKAVADAAKRTKWTTRRSKAVAAAAKRAKWATPTPARSWAGILRVSTLPAGSYDESFDPTL